MNNKLLDFNLSKRTGKNIPELKTGDIVKVHRKIKEGSKERIQIFEGMIIAKKGGQSSSPIITVRKTSGGVGVELVLPVYSPSIEKIDIVKKAKVRRSKLYYIRDKSAKSLRLKYKDMASFAGIEEEKLVVEEEKDETVSESDSVEKVEDVKVEESVDENKDVKEKK